MVIDDESDIVSVLTRGLTLKGLEVHGFSDPAEALKHFKPGSFDFVITDIKMPEINGFQLFRKLREKDERESFLPDRIRYLREGGKDNVSEP